MSSMLDDIMMGAKMAGATAKGLKITGKCAVKMGKMLHSAYRNYAEAQEGKTETAFVSNEAIRHSAEWKDAAPENSNCPFHIGG